MGTKLDFPGGGYVIVNDPDEVPGMIKTIQDFNRNSEQFHNRLMEAGVKAYRCNDGWVDRVKHIVTFFVDERNRGWYWGNMHLNKGDKIFLGDPSDGGQFAIIDGVAKQGWHCVSYHYHLIDECISTKPPKPKPRWQRVRDYITKLFQKTNESI